MQLLFQSRYVTFFDTELTSWPGTNERDWTGPGEHREIVQLCAIRVDAADDFREIEHFEIFVRPTVNPILSEYLIDLIGITQEKIDTDGVAWPEAQPAFRAFLDKQPGDVCCNGIDDIVLDENAALNDIEPGFAGIRFVNLKPVFMKAFDNSSRDSQTANLATLAGLDMDHNAHNALDDVRVLVATVRALAHRGDIVPVGQSVHSESAS